MPSTIDHDYGDGGSTFTIGLSITNQAFNWSAGQDFPVGTPFKLSYYRAGIQAPKITYAIYFDNNVPAWLSLSGQAVLANNEISCLGAGAKTLVPLFSTLQDIPDGTYSAEIRFTAWDGSNWFDEASMMVYLAVYNGEASAVGFGKRNYSVLYNRQTGALSGDIQIGVKNTPGAALIFEAKYFKTKSVSGDFVLEGENISGNPELPGHGVVGSQAVLKKSDGSVAASAQIQLAIIENSDIIANVSGLNFSVPKSSQQSAAQSFSLTNPENSAYTITAPSWLQVSPANGNGSESVTVVAQIAGLNSGDYKGDIVISYNGKSLKIPVTLNVYGFMTFTETEGFCLDIPEVKFKRINLSARFVRITVFSDCEIMGTKSSREHAYIVPYVGDAASFVLGEKIHRLHPRHRGEMFSVNASQIFMKEAVVRVVAEEVDAAYTPLMQESIQNIRLLPGRRPAGFPLLSNYLHRHRNSRSTLMLSDVANNNVNFRRLENFADNSVNFNGHVLSIYSFPDNFINIDVQWENQNLVPEWFSFSGEYKITAEYSHVVAKNIFEGHSEKFDSSRTRSISLNTGFLLAVERELLSEMVLSKIIFLRIEGRVYRAFCTSQKLIENDSSDELVARDLEFLIVEK